MNSIFIIRFYTFILLFSLIFTSCDKDDADNKSFSIPIKIITSNNELIPENTQLEVFYEDVIYSEFNSSDSDQFNIQYNEVEFINLDNVSSTFYFFLEDSELGVIEQRFTKEQLLSYNESNPLILEFGAHLSEIIFTVNVKAPDNGFIDMVVHLFETTLYHVDWGDGTADTKKTPDSHGTFQDDFLNHYYKDAGNYTITVRATRTGDVKGIALNNKVTNRPAVNLGIQLNNLDNLEEFSLGYNSIESIDEVIAKLSNLKDLSLRFGVMTHVDLTHNKDLESLLLNSSYFEEIKGLHSLSKLKWLGLRTYNQIDLSKFPDLEFINLSENNMTELDVSKNTKLKTIYCWSTKLLSIDLSNNPDLESISFKRGSLTTIDISNLEKLKSLNISYQDIKSIKYPSSLNEITHINLEHTLITNVRELLDLLYKGQEENPREGVRVYLDNESIVPLKDIEKLEQLEENYKWDITY